MWLMKGQISKLVPVQLILPIGGEEAAGGFTKEFSEFSQLGDWRLENSISRSDNCGINPGWTRLKWSALRVRLRVRAS